MHNKTIFITGATGLVGGLLALRALAAGYQLRLLVRGRVDFATEERIRQVFSFLGMPQEEWGVVRHRERYPRRYSATGGLRDKV